MTLFLSSTDADFEQKFKAFLAVKRENDPDVNAVVAEIVADVRKKGDEALCAYTQKFDRVNLTPATMRVSQSEIDEAVAACDKDVLDALYLAAERIETFHEKQLPESHFFNDETDALMGWRWTPVFSAGL